MIVTISMSYCSGQNCSWTAGTLVIESLYRCEVHSGMCSLGHWGMMVMSYCFPLHLYSYCIWSSSVPTSRPGSPGAWSVPVAPSPSDTLGTLLPTVVRSCLLFGLMTCFAALTVIAEPKGEEGTGFSRKKLAQRWNWKEQKGLQCPKVFFQSPPLADQINSHNSPIWTTGGKVSSASLHSQISIPQEGHPHWGQPTTSFPGMGTERKAVWRSACGKHSESASGKWPTLTTPSPVPGSHGFRTCNLLPPALCPSLQIQTHPVFKFLSKYFPGPPLSHA